MLNERDAAAFERCIEDGGVVLFPADTVYGLACSPSSPDAVARLYGLKGRRADKPAAVMFFALAHALAALPELGPRSRAALMCLLPGPLTLLLPDPAGRYPLASGPEAGPHVLGVRVPRLAPPLSSIATAVLQSSANRAGEPDARRLADVAEPIRAGADLVLDGGDLPGTPSTVVDLTSYEDAGVWSVARAGAATSEWLAERLDGAVGS